jgi:hypothetical protein
MWKKLFEVRRRAFEIGKYEDGLIESNKRYFRDKSRRKFLKFKKLTKLKIRI